MLVSGMNSAPPKLSLLPKKIHGVFFDFDGVFTDNRVWISGSGEEIVACHRGDGMGISMLKAASVPCWVLSTETNPVVAKRCEKLAISFRQSLEHKAGVLKKLAAEFSWNLQNVIYVGNDLNDLECMRIVGCPVAVADAVPEVLSTAKITLQNSGGHGAVRELCDLILLNLQHRSF